jgi:hypothetical protein
MTKPKFSPSLSSLLPFVRQSLNGLGLYHRLEFLDFANRLWAALETIQASGIYKEPDGALFAFSRYKFMQSPTELRLAATEAFDYLHTSGLTLHIPDENPASFFNVPGSQALSGYYITERGARWIASAEPVPEDSALYMEHLHKRVPNLDAVIKEYIAEGLSAFVRGNNFSAAVMIGAASEKAIYLLGTSIIPALKDPIKQSQLKNKIEKERTLKKLYEFIKKELERGYQNNQIPHELHESSLENISALIEAIRVQRNDAVHPQNAKVTPDDVRVFYGVFPTAMEKIENLREWCDRHHATL